MNNRQIEELAKLSLDLGKLVFASLVLGFFQSKLELVLSISYGLIGLTIAIAFFTIGLRLLKEVH